MCVCVWGGMTLNEGQCGSPFIKFTRPLKIRLRSHFSETGEAMTMAGFESRSPQSKPHALNPKAAGLPSVLHPSLPSTLRSAHSKGRVKVPDS